MAVRVRSGHTPSFLSCHLQLRVFLSGSTIPRVPAEPGLAAAERRGAARGEDTRAEHGAEAGTMSVGTSHHSPIRHAPCLA